MCPLLCPPTRSNGAAEPRRRLNHNPRVGGSSSSSGMNPWPFQALGTRPLTVVSTSLRVHFSSCPLLFVSTSLRVHSRPSERRPIVVGDGGGGRELGEELRASVRGGASDRVPRGPRDRSGRPRRPRLSAPGSPVSSRASPARSTA